MTSRPVSIKPGSASQLVPVNKQFSWGDFLIIGSLFLTALALPLIDCRLPNMLGGMRLSDGLAMLAGSFYLISRWLGQLVRRPTRPWVWPLGRAWGFFLLAILVSSLASPWSLASIGYGLKTIVFAYFFYVAIPVNVLDTWRKWRWILWGIIGAGVYSAIIGLWSLTHQDWSNVFFRVQPAAILGHWWLGANHNLLAEFLVISNFFLLAGRQLISRPLQRRYLDILFIILLTITLLTFSRAAWLAVGLQLVLWWAMSANWRRKAGWAIAVGLMAIIMLPVWWRMTDLQASNYSSTENRWLLSQIAVDGLIDRPILGWGSGQYIRLVENNLRFRAKYGEPIDSHGLAQKVAAENGLVGLAALAILLFSLMAYWYRLWYRYAISRAWVTPLILGAVGGLAFQLFNTSYYKGRLWLPIALTLAVGQLLSYERSKKR